METRSPARVVITVAAGALVLGAVAVKGVVQTKRGLVAYQARVESLGDEDPAPETSRVKVLSEQVAPTSIPGREATLGGEVLEGRTGLPVTGARVELETYRVSARTDEDGMFEFLGLPIDGSCSLVTIEVRRNGYPRLRQVDLPLFPGAQSITLMLGLTDEESGSPRQQGRATSACGRAAA